MNTTHRLEIAHFKLCSYFRKIRNGTINTKEKHLHILRKQKEKIKLKSKKNKRTNTVNVRLNT